MVARIATLASSLVLTACGTSAAVFAPYSRMNGGGYTETEVQPGVFLVQFIGNQWTPPDQPADFALLRAAELCLQRGKGYLFMGNPVMHYVPNGAPSGTTTVVPASETSQVVTTESSTLPISPTGGVMVSCAETKAEGAWDAQYLARAIRTKYSIS